LAQGIQGLALGIGGGAPIALPQGLKGLVHGLVGIAQGDGFLPQFPHQVLPQHLQGLTQILLLARRLGRGGGLFLGLTMGLFQQTLLPCRQIA